MFFIHPLKLGVNANLCSRLTSVGCDFIPCITLLNFDADILTIIGLVDTRNSNRCSSLILNKLAC